MNVNYNDNNFPIFNLTSKLVTSMPENKSLQKEHKDEIGNSATPYSANDNFGETMDDDVFNHHVDDLDNIITEDEGGDDDEVDNYYLNYSGYFSESDQKSKQLKISQSSGIENELNDNVILIAQNTIGDIEIDELLPSPQENIKSPSSAISDYIIEVDLGTPIIESISPLQEDHLLKDEDCNVEENTKIKKSPKTIANSIENKLSRQCALSIKTKLIKKHLVKRKRRKKIAKKPEYIPNIDKNSEDTYFALSLVGSLQRLKPMQRAMAKLNILKYLTDLEYADQGNPQLPSIL